MLVKINWNPQSKDLKKFGMTIIVGFFLIGTIMGWRKSWEVAYWIWALSWGIGLTGIFLPLFSKPFYFLWMGIALVMGTIISTVILFIIFYLIIAPVGIFMRVLGRDPLRMKKKNFEGGTYWQAHPEKFEKNYFKRLF